jgi:hypothetical protein
MNKHTVIAYGVAAFIFILLLWTYLSSDAAFRVILPFRYNPLLRDITDNP